MTLLTVLVVTAGVALLIVLASWLGHSVESSSAEETERWMIAHAPRRVRRALRYAERRTAGGVLTVLAFVVVFGTATVLGFLLDAIDGNRGIASWDESAAEWGARHASTTSTNILKAITELGATTSLVILMTLIGLLALVRDRRIGSLAYLTCVGLGVTLVNNGLKLAVDRERPDIAQLAGHGGSSFPSGHSAAAAACWAAIVLVVTRHHRRPVRSAAAFVAVLIAVAVATSRVLLGVHWLTDVIAGVMVGWAWFFLVTLIFGGRLLRFGEPVEEVPGRPPELNDDRTADDRVGEPFGEPTSTC